VKGTLHVAYWLIDVFSAEFPVLCFIKKLFKFTGSCNTRLTGRRPHIFLCLSHQPHIIYRLILFKYVQSVFDYQSWQVGIMRLLGREWVHIRRSILFVLYFLKRREPLIESGLLVSHYLLASFIDEGAEATRLTQILEYHTVPLCFEYLLPLQILFD